MIEISSLSYEANKKYRAAIQAGYFDNYEENPRKWRHTFAGAFLWKNPSRLRLMRTFTEMLGYVPQWEDVTEDNLRDLIIELQEDGLAQSSIRTLCAELKAVLNENYKSVPCQRDDFQSILSIKPIASQAVYLTREEMWRIINYHPHTEIERSVQRNFCVEMLTGARLVDAEQLTMANCDIDTNTLSYVPEKTPGIVVYVPVDERMPLRQFLIDDQVRRCNNDTFNECIRHICKMLHIDTPCTIIRAGVSVTAPKWQLISSHTARRSFATNLYLAGISIEDIALMMGHGKNIDTTKRYICAERKLSPSVLSYFRNNDNEQQQQPTEPDWLYRQSDGMETATN